LNTLFSFVHLDNPELVLKPIIANIREYAVNRAPKIIITPLGGDVVLYGATALALNPPHILAQGGMR